MDLSCSIDPPTTQEEMAQSAHLMTLGLCRISATKPPPSARPPPSASQPIHPSSDPSPHVLHPNSPKQRDVKQQVRTSPCSKRRQPCLLCPLTLPSRRLLDVHVRSHQASGGFSCVCCSWKTDSWEELEPHWRSHCRRQSRTDEPKQKKKKKKRGPAAVPGQSSGPVCLKTFSTTSPKVLTHTQNSQRRHSTHPGQRTLYCSF